MVNVGGLVYLVGPSAQLPKTLNFELSWNLELLTPWIEVVVFPSEFYLDSSSYSSSS